MSIKEAFIIAKHCLPKTSYEYVYELISEFIFSEDLGNYTSYGISVIQDGKEIYRISDVCTDPAPLTELCQKCTDLGLEPIHLRDVIEDFLE